MTAKFLGLQYPLMPSPRGLMAQKSGTDQIKADLLQLLLTNPGERCLTGDTMIPLANGTEHPISELVDKAPFWVYSFDVNSNRVVPGMAIARKTIENAQLVEVTLDNEISVRCTPDHLWMLRNGEYKQANQLLPGDSLMPLYRHLNTSKYERVYQPYLGDYRETHLCFVFGTRLTGISEVVHHKDLNKRNNEPTNLQWMTCKGHKELHREIRNKFNERLRSDPEFYADWKAKVTAGLRRYFETHDGNRKGAVLTEETKKKLSEAKLAFYDTKEGKQEKENLREKALKQFEDGSPFKGKKHSKAAKQKMRGPRSSIVGDNNPSKRPDVREKLKAAWVKRKQKNHKVLSVKNLDVREDCYDLTVETYHNFGLSAGVFVHNCMLPTFGTPLRKLIFEPNDASLALQAKQMISDAILLWEPRIVVQDIQVSSSIDKSELNPLDNGTEVEGILSIQISFVDPQNIQTVESLVLQVPIGG